MPLAVALQLADPAPNAPFRVLANRAGVHEDHIGALGCVHAHEALVDEQPLHQLGVVDVHLTPVGLDVDQTPERAGTAGAIRAGRLQGDELRPLHGRLSAAGGRRRT